MKSGLSFALTSSNTIGHVDLICKKNQRAITVSKFDEMCSKVNQVIYSSAPISTLDIKALACMVLKIFC